MTTLVKKIERLLQEELGNEHPSLAAASLIHQVRDSGAIPGRRINFFLTASEVAALIGASYALGHYEGAAEAARDLVTVYEDDGESYCVACDNLWSNSYLNADLLCPSCAS